MIKVIRSGEYRLIETTESARFLMLDAKTVYAWTVVDGIGELFTTAKRSHRTDSLVGMGRYRLYNVQHEDQLTDLQHLELLVGKGKWQGYLLPTGLPTEKEKSTQIVPTGEQITCAFLDCWAADYPISSFSRSAIL